MSKGFKHRLTYNGEGLSLNVAVRVTRLEDSGDKRIKKVAENGSDIFKRVYLKEWKEEVVTPTMTDLIGKSIGYGFIDVDDRGQRVEATKYVDTRTGEAVLPYEKSEIDILGTLPRTSVTNFIECGTTLITGETVADTVGLYKLYRSLVESDKVAYSTVTFMKGTTQYLLILVPFIQPDTTKFMLLGKLVNRKIPVELASQVPSDSQIARPTPRQVSERELVASLVGV